MPRKLRVVEPGETPDGPRSMSVSDAAASGTELELLMAMRDRLATAVTDPNCPPRDLAALTRRLREVTKDIDALKLREQEESGAEQTPDEDWDAEAL